MPMILMATLRAPKVEDLHIALGEAPFSWPQDEQDLLALYSLLLERLLLPEPCGHIAKVPQ